MGRVQLLIGQSTLQIQEQSTLGTMQQSSLQHYSVLGSLLGNYMESTDRTRMEYIGQCGAVQSYSRTWYRLVQLARKDHPANLLGLISRSMLITRKKKKKWD